jgi:transcriptional regulator with XRE-family HTH domain
MPNLRQKFGQRLRAIRKQQQLTQEGLAELCNLSTDFISLIERGINAPSFEVIESLAKALNVSERAFFDWDDD